MTGKNNHRFRKTLFFNFAFAAALGLTLPAAVHAQEQRSYGASPAQVGAGEPDRGGHPAITPRRPLPEDRFDFRGEHAGVIYTPSGYRTIGGAGGRGVVGVHGGFDEFIPAPGHEGVSVYVPYDSHESSISEPIALGSSYEIVRRPVETIDGVNTPGGQPGKPREKQGPRIRAREEIVEGEFVKVYHPAVYERDADGELRLVEPESWTKTPKVRIVIERGDEK